MTASEQGVSCRQYPIAQPWLWHGCQALAIAVGAVLDLKPCPRMSCAHAFRHDPIWFEHGPDCATSCRPCAKSASRLRTIKAAV